MKRFLKSFRHGEIGFTLIELLIVLAILGAMAGAIIPNLQRFTKSGTKSACLNEAQVIQTAVDAAMADGGIVTLDDDTTIGPEAVGNEVWLISDGVNDVDVGEFIRRTIEGEYSADIEGFVTVIEYIGLDDDDIDEINLKLQ